ncbi:hypothetical protein [Psychroflexus aestuariivivens]|uniref:hypothetical protein n=1 Tax=Psychroflexus aestuariivivens TaxID=1795040 RepID=UPI000FD803A5|nr:hypothetical protein [Psychroflexus aestuariivivens]
MQKFKFLFLILSLFLLSCEDDDSEKAIDLSVEGKTFELSSFILSESVDLNNDGVFTTDVCDEDGDCYYQISFSDGGTVKHPAAVSYHFRVEENSNGELEQNFRCGHWDHYFPTWKLDNNTVSIIYDNEVDLEGTITDDGQTITFDVPIEKSPFLSDGSYRSILTESGDVIEYEDSMKMIYTLSN